MLRKVPILGIKYFYPRSPCGERQTATPMKTPPYNHFYPRSPCGERPWTRGSRITYIEFLSTLSLRRATYLAFSHRTVNIHFYPRSPCGERHTCPIISTTTLIFLSTLSLRRATDADHAQDILTAFLSTLSLRRATLISMFNSPHSKISIHALLAESDSKSAQNSGALLRIWNKFYGDCIFMLTGKAVFYPFCPCFFHIFWCEGSGNFMIAFPSH